MAYNPGQAVNTKFVSKQNPKQNLVTFDVSDEYHLLKTIGTGAYGIVCSAIHKKTGQYVAIKKIANPFDVLTTAKRTLRELKLLLHFKHDNIVGVKNILHRAGDSPKKRDVYVIMDLMESDLHHVIRSQQSLTEDHICYFLYQLLRGLKYIHSANVIHRDLKPSNLLVNENCELKIGDFGMARGVANSPEDNRMFMTEYVATRWYRAPELMLSMLEYSMAIDMWSVGCIFAEMMARKQLFPGRHYVHQLQLIISVLGSPSKNLINSIRSEKVKSYVQNLPHKDAVPLKTLFPKASVVVIDLMSRFLRFDPASRCSAADALKHQFFRDYHEEDDEPECPRLFDFRFETESQAESGPSKDSVKKQVMDLIESYHDRRNRLKKQLIFLPKSTSPTSQPVKPILQPVPATSSLDELKEDGRSVLDPFKRPTQIPPVAKLSTKKSIGNLSATSSKVEDGVELMSAKSGEVDTKADSLELQDVQMNSAKCQINFQQSDLAASNKADEEKTKVLPSGGLIPSECGKKNPASSVKKTISETTRMLVRDTILASMLARKNGLTKQPEKPKKPVTAAERQREREEKRRKRQEKAAEKERKKREQERSKPMLSDQDKTLLERWSKMQQNAKTSHDTTGSGEENASKTEEKRDTLLSPNSLTRQNSLPNLATPRSRACSNPDVTSPSRRWSLNSDLAQNTSDSNFLYVPSLAEIPPSPMNQSYSYPATTAPSSKQALLTVVVDQASVGNQRFEKSAHRQKVHDCSISQSIHVIENEQATIPRQHIPERAVDDQLYVSAKEKAPVLRQSLFQYTSGVDIPMSTGSFASLVPEKPGMYSVGMPMQPIFDTVGVSMANATPRLVRPSTLDTGSVSTAPDRGNKLFGQLSGLSATLPSASLLNSSKSLVTLSPDTVDFVLNQELQQEVTALKTRAEQEAFNSVKSNSSKESSDGVLTLSPGETSLIVRSTGTRPTANFTSIPKSASIEFSPNTFLVELDECANQSDANYKPTPVDSRFLQGRNGSAMLSQSVAKNPVCVRENRLQPGESGQRQLIRQPDNPPFLNEVLVGGYGIGYEPDAEGFVPEDAMNTMKQSYEMECDSAKSSSSLLNDWLEVSQMEQHDIEQLQRELELGSPMCIDDCTFKTS